MNRRSIPSFVLSLIAGIFTAYIGFYVAWISMLIGAFGGIEYILFLIAGWACIIGSVVGIVGGSFCFKRARVGAIILTVVTATAGVALVWVFIKIMSVSPGAVTAEDGTVVNPGLVMGILTLAPAIMYIVATICAYLAKPINKQEPQQFAYQTVQTPEQASEKVVQNVETPTSNDIKIE